MIELIGIGGFEKGIGAETVVEDGIANTGLAHAGQTIDLP